MLKNGVLHRGGRWKLFSNVVMQSVLNWNVLNTMKYVLYFVLGSICGIGCQVFANENAVEGYVFEKTVQIVFDGSSATVTNDDPESIEVSQTGSDIAIVSEIKEGVAVILSGKGGIGSVQIACAEPAKVVLNGLELTGTTIAPIESLSTNRVFVVLATGKENILREGTNKISSKGILASAGSMIISGTGSLNLEGAVKRHAICSSGGSVIIRGGDILVSRAANDGVHAEIDFQMDNGTLSIPGAVGDGVDCAGDITINGGSILFASEVADIRGLKCDGQVCINGGLINMNIGGVQSKGIKCTDADIHGGTMLIDLSGDVLLETVQVLTTNLSRVTTNNYVAPSYCSAMKCSGNTTITAGSVTVTHTGIAGRGISTDGDFIMSGGNLDFYMTGKSSATYKNESASTDVAASDCIVAEGNMKIYSGNLTAIATGNAGDGISCKGEMFIGQSGVEDTPVLTVKTKGSKVALSGSGMSASYANPKAIKSIGNMSIDGGRIFVTTQYDGGEGIESKGSVTINDGVLEIEAYDDCINAARSVVINGGLIYCYSAGNDAIDSNGTLTINGGTIIASGTTAPEEGFDCDQNTFKITGGILIGTGGATSTPTSSQCTQRSIVYKGTGTADTTFQIKSSDGDVLVYKIPRTYSSSGGGGFGGPGGGSGMVLLFSSPNLNSSVTYTITTGGSITSGSDFHGYYTGATVSGGTTLKTFKPASMVTTVQ